MMNFRWRDPDGDCGHVVSGPSLGALAVQGYTDIPEGSIALFELCDSDNEPLEAVWLDDEQAATVVLVLLQGMALLSPAAIDPSPEHSSLAMLRALLWL